MADLAYVHRLPGGIRGAARLLTSRGQQVGSRHLFVVDGLGISVAVSVALAATTDELSSGAVLGPYLWLVAIIVPAQLAVNLLLGLYASSWNFTDVREAWRIPACTLAGTASAVLITLALTSLRTDVVGGPPPAAFWAMQATLTLGVLAIPRLTIRYASELIDRDERRNGRQRTLLYGAGWAGAIVARSAERHPGAGVTPVGFLDDDPNLRGSRVGGLPVLGDASAMAVARRRTGASALLITMPYSTGADVRRVVDAASTLSLPVRTVPAMAELLDGMIDVSRARGVRAEDLLRSSPAAGHSPALTSLVQGRAVVITGAAGQIGSELARQILVLEPARIVMVDQAEHALSVVAGELQHFDRVAQGSTLITTHLVDVTDRLAIAKLIRRTSPVAIFHAAALTQVSTIEEHAAHATRVNIGGTKSLVDAAIDCGVERFVLASTDKAFEPSSVMGASMRIAEMVVGDAARCTGGTFGSVRFGSLLDSSGSAVLALRSQLEGGQPLTVSASERTCYPMSVAEASRLILETAARTEPGGLYLLDRGAPIRIGDVASDLVRLAGRDPDSVPIKIVGGPGEKLQEELRHHEENATPTEIPKVLRLATEPAIPVTIRADVERFLAVARAGRNDVLRTDLLRYVRSTVPIPVSSGNGASSRGVPMGANGNGSAPKTSHGNGVRPRGREPALMHEKVVIKPHAVIRVAGDGAQAATDQTGPRGAARK